MASAIQPSMKWMIRRATASRTASVNSSDGAYENLLAELPSPSTGPTVHVPRETLFEAQLRTRKDLGVELLRIVHDDDHGGSRPQLKRRVPKDANHGVHVGAQGSTSLASVCRPNLRRASIH